MATSKGTQPTTKAPLWNHQANALEFIRYKPGAMLAMQMGTGKDLADDTPIATPTGWTTMGDLRPGDQVIDEQGHACRVTAVFPQGRKPTFNVVFDDGTELVTGKDHQWVTLTRSDRLSIEEGTRQGEDWSSGLLPVTTGEIRDSLLHQAASISESMHSIPTAKPLQLPEQELPVDPYVLGLWLGRGKTENAGVTCDKRAEGRYAVEASENLSVRNAEAEAARVAVVEEPEARFGTGGRLEEFRRERIPPQHLRASKDQRLALLQGLMDSAGHLSKAGNTDFLTPSRNLAEDTLDLALSLGQKATFCQGVTTSQGRRNEARYGVRFTPTINVFRSRGKAGQLQRQLDRRQHALTQEEQRYIREITEAEPTETTCITVDSASSLFLAGRQMVPTHNTRCAIEHIHAIGAKNILILAPLAVVDHVWEDQINLHTDRPLKAISLGQRYTSTARKIKAAEMARAGTNPKNPLAYILNYESVLTAPFRKWAGRQNFDLIILDECHKIKSADGKISTTVAELCDRTPRRLGLTGTPMPHSPLDIFAQYRAIDPRIFGDSYHRFRHRYAILELKQVPHHKDRNKTKKVYDIAGFQNREELEQKFRNIAFQVNSADVLDLPKFNKSYQRVYMREEGRAIYQDMEETFKAELESGEVARAKNPLSQLLRLQQITSGFMVDSESDQHTIIPVDDSKEKALTDILSNIAPEESVVVFARFINDLKTIRKAARANNRLAWEHSGQIKEIDSWQHQGGVIAMQIQAGGVGIDLTKARYCVYYSMGFSLGDYEQSMYRLHRPGQTRPVTYLHLIASDTIDEKVIRSLHRKQNVVANILHTKDLRN